MTTEAAAKTATGTEYVVLEMVTIPGDTETGSEPFEAWVVAGQSPALATKKAAIESAVGEQREGIFKAVPIRSWKGALKTKPKTGLDTEELDI